MKSSRVDRRAILAVALIITTALDSNNAFGAVGEEHLPTADSVSAGVTATKPQITKPQLTNPPVIRSAITESTAATVPFIDLTNPVSTPEPSMDGGINKDALINFGIWMIVIMCLCGLTVLGLRTMNVRTMKASNSVGNSRIVDTLNLGKHRLVQLIEIGGRSVLVASDAGGIRSVVPMVDQFSDALFDDGTPVSPEQQPSFRDYSPQDR